MSRIRHGGVARWRLERRRSEADALIADAHRHLDGRRRDHARRLVKEALLTEMSLVEGLEIGRLLHALDETQAAVDLYGTLLRQAHDAVDAATVRAGLLMLLGRYDEAVEPLRFLVEHGASDPEARLHLAQCLARSGRHDEAVVAARAVGGELPPWADMHLELGRLLLRLGDLATARVTLSRAVEVSGRDAGPVTLAVAALWQRAGRPDEALPHYREALRRRPDDGELIVEAGQAFARAGRLDEAGWCLDRLTERGVSDDARRRLISAIEEAGGVGAAREAGQEPAGFASVIPAPGDATLGDMTTGEVEAALDTLDFDLDDSFGSVPDLGDVEPIPAPLGVDDPSLSGASTQRAAPSSERRSSAPPPSRPSSSERRSSAPPPSRPSSERSSAPPPSRASSSAPPPSRAPSSAPPSSRAPSSAPPAAAPSSRPPAVPARASSRRFDEVPTLHGDIDLDGADSDPPPPRTPVVAPRRDSRAFALIAPPSSSRRRPTGSLPVDRRRSTGPLPVDRRRSTGPLPVDASTLPPLMAFGSLSGEEGGELDGSGERSGSSERSGSRERSGSSERAGRGHRPRSAPPRVAEPTGPMPRLPRSKRYGEAAVSRGLTSPGIPLPDARPGADGFDRLGDDALERLARGPAGTPPPMSPGWGAAPRHNPVLTTSDALQRWRPPAERAAPAPPARKSGRTSVLAGAARLVWLPRLLRLMATGRLTGTLRVVAPEGHGEVQFRLGRLTGATVSNRPSLAATLARVDKLSPEQRLRLGSVSEDGEALLDRLVDAGLFEHANVNSAVIDQVFAAVGDLVTWHDGWFTLSTRSDPGGQGSRARLPLATLLGALEDDREASASGSTGGSMGSMGSMGARAAVTDPPRDPRVEARITGQRERLAQAPDDLGARQQLADLLSRAGDHDEAIEVLTAGRGGALDEDSMAAVARAITALARRGPRRQRSPIALCGRLGRVGMVPLLELLAQEGATGTLRLIGTEGQSAIHFVDGRLAGASNSNTARLGDLLQASSAASAAQVEALVERQRALPGHPPLGQLAIASGLIGPAPLKGLLQKQVRLALLESGRWRRAHFVFDRDERRRAGHPERDLDTETIVRDLQRMIGHVR